MLASNRNLTDLDLSSNNLSDGGVRWVAQGLSHSNVCQNSSLRRLCLAENALSSVQSPYTST